VTWRFTNERVNVNKLTVVTTAAAFLIAASGFAQADPRDSAQIAQTKSNSAPMSDGEVRKVDKEAGKITIKHGPLANLDMPGMTMVFRVKDPAMLDRVKEGDKIKFVANRMNGSLTVIQMEPSK
jgi:Cu(I)/Ag(I) efflux system periplasmic protein CusF